MEQEPTIGKCFSTNATTFGHPIHPDVGKLAKLGTSGEYVGNVRRDALRFYKPSQGLSTPLWLKLPFWDTQAVDARLPNEMQFPLILPSVLFEDLYRNFRRKTQDMLRGWRPSVLGLHA